MKKDTSLIWLLAQKEGTSPFERFASKLLKDERFHNHRLYTVQVSKTKGFELGLDWSEGYILTDSSCEVYPYMGRNSTKEKAKAIEKEWVDYLVQKCEPYKMECLEQLKKMRDYHKKQYEHYESEISKVKECFNKKASPEKQK